MQRKQSCCSTHLVCIVKLKAQMQVHSMHTRFLSFFIRIAAAEADAASAETHHLKQAKFYGTTQVPKQ